MSDRYSAIKPTTALESGIPQVWNSKMRHKKRRERMMQDKKAMHMKTGRYRR